MIRKLIYLLILALLVFVPVKKLDVAKLEPVEVVSVQCRDGGILLQTDTEAWGFGADAAAALEDMQKRTPGVIYLDTAEFLLVSEAALHQIQALRPWLKERVKLCQAEAADLKTAAHLLEIHDDLPRLRDWIDGQILPQIQDGKFIE